MDRTTIKAISLGVFLLTLAPAAVKRIREAGLGKVMLLRVAGDSRSCRSWPGRR